MPRVYLVSRRLDPLLGIVSGLWAYHLYETRANRPPGHRLHELVQRKWELRRAAKEQAAASEEGWKELEDEFKAKASPSASSGRL